MCHVNEFGKYIDIMLNSDFPQSYLLDLNEFLKFLKDMGFKTNLRDLEYYDEKGILKPAARLNLKQVRSKLPKYETIFSDIFTMKEVYYKEGRLEIVRNDFQPWKNYKDDLEHKTILYYHPFQFLPLRRLEMGLHFTLKGYHFDNENDQKRRFTFMKNTILERLKSSKKNYNEFWAARIGLLVLLDEAYGPLVKGFRININEDSNKYYKKWKEWRKKKFEPRRLLKICNLSLKDVKLFYDVVATDGQSVDPLENWYVLQRIIKKSWLLRLKNEAFQAQQCYKLSWMLYKFILDLSGEKMFEPDDIMDGNGHGAWKKDVYGSPFNYNTRKTQKNILDIFLINRQFRAGIVFEGDTEEIVIESILRALDVDKKKDGLFLHNAEGQLNIGENLRAMYGLSSLENISLFIILDNDNKVKKIKEKLQKFMKTKSIKIWKGDFENDNFGVVRVLQEINKELKARNFEEIKRNEVLKKLNDSHSLMKIIEIICGEKNRIDLYSLLPKKVIARRIIKERILEIEKERKSLDGWKPKLPIEKVLRDILKTMPMKSFTYTDY